MLKQLLYHILFWLISLSLCAFIIGYQNSWQQAFTLTIIYAPIPIISAYFIDRVLIERFLLKRKLFRFTLYLIYLLIASAFLMMILNTLIFINIAKYQYALLPHALKDIVVLFSNLYLIVFLFVSMQSVIKYSQLLREQEASLKKIAQAELKLLRSQLNPHFLFNTLNNLYSLALQKSDKAPEAILKLSSLLDSVLHANNFKTVSLTEELKVVDDYIYLESLRYVDRIELAKTYSIDNTEKIYVPPLSVLLLIENCFKHGAQLSNNKLKIDLNIAETDSFLMIKTKNRFDKNKHNNSIGIGLDNLNKQLAYIYKGKAVLKTTIKEDLFIVELNLPK